MFSSRRLGLFDNIPCPDRISCKRNPCIFSHQSNLPEPAAVHIPITADSATINVPSTSASSCGLKSILKTNHHHADTSASVPAKRPILSSPTPSGSSATRLTLKPTSPTSEPPRKLQKITASKRGVPVAGAQPPKRRVRHASSLSKHKSGEPILSVNPAASKVAVPVRQTCLKSLFDAYVHLYAAFHTEHPHLAHDHSLAQEEDVYNKTNKQTYRQGVVSSIVSIKKRVKPTSHNHDSVGTEAACQARAKARTLKRIEPHHLEDALIPLDQFEKWGYIVDVPEGPGGDRPSEEGYEMKCERCTQRFIVTRLGQGKDEVCSFHWARPYTMTVNGEKIKTYKCCSMTHPGPGCSNGPHVFMEKAPGDLHRRHAFSLSSQPAATLPGAEDSVLDVAAMDCEMIYTTGGMRVARVSVVDGDGREVFDQFVRMDEGVEVIDYVTQFSGVTPELLASAVLDLAAVRQALRALIGPNTILIGHALDNDLKTLRMVHHRVVDTSILFPHRAGPPYRRALRDLVSDKLNKMIQTGGGKTGHSSVEDASATLDLVRWWVVNERPTRAKASGAGAGR